MSELKLPDTGVRQCYDAQAMPIDTPAAGEPFYGQDGCFEIHPMRYTKLDAEGRPLSDPAMWEDGYRTVRDENTGLVWEIKSPDPEAINHMDGTYAWEAAGTEYIEAMNQAAYGGFSDWRLPNKDELRSILNYARTNPAVDTWYFPHTVTDAYWVANTFAMQPELGWILFFGFGSATASGLTIPRHVRAVRGGHDTRFGIADPARFVDNGDGTVTDTITRLMWQQGENERMSWFDALESCAGMTLAGHKDWRLPSIKELNTILNLDYTDGWWYFRKAFPADGLEPPLLHYYSSTPFEKHYVWVTNFCFGYDGYYAGKGAPLLHRAVRNLDTPPAAPAGFRLSDTGQSECYNDEGAVIDPPGAGERFAGQDGTRTCHPFSFTGLRYGGEALPAGTDWDDGMEMVRDNNTGLVWEVKSPDPDDFNSALDKYSFDDAEAFVEQMNAEAYGGFGDWRLPNREELRSIVDYGRASPALAEAFGRDAPSEFFWSCDPYGPTPNLVWGVYFGYGCGICYPRHNRYAVRAVRGGFNRAFGDITARDMVDNGNGTVTDRVTGLMWKQAESPSLNWAEALAYCNTLELAGYSDWRLPGIREISTLLDLSFQDQTWFDKAFPDTQTKPLGFYWASTTFGATFAWGVNFQFGYDGYYAGKKHGTYPFRPVRTVG